MIDTDKLYKETIEGESISPFSYLPRMHLLCLMQYIIRRHYSYEFLKKAIEDSIKPDLLPTEAINGEGHQEANEFEQEATLGDGVNVAGQPTRQPAESRFDPLANRLGQELFPQGPLALSVFAALREQLDATGSLMPPAAWSRSCS
jgi:hypothetical protein